MKKIAFLFVFLALILSAGLVFVLRTENIQETLLVLSGKKKEPLGVSEVLVQGIVAQNNVGAPGIGAFLHIKRSDTNEDVFVVYKPFTEGTETNCVNNMDVSRIGVGMYVAARGIIIEEVRGMKPRSLMLSTCESLEYYITVLNEEKPQETIPDLFTR